MRTFPSFSDLGAEDTALLSVEVSGKINDDESDEMGRNLRITLEVETDTG